MELRFRPQNSDYPDERGLFDFEFGEIVSKLGVQVAAHKLKRDQYFLDWLMEIKHDLKLGEVLEVPNRFDTALRMLVPDLVGLPIGQVKCLDCDSTYSLRQINVSDWRDVDEVNGIRVGVEGFVALCPQGHSLLHVASKIF
ncbi:MAG: hypothetical protein HS116_19590 [Planctomycetes bacterium]|nr:hypothetical protein [Planctomycetota bacterium]